MKSPFFTRTQLPFLFCLENSSGQKEPAFFKRAFSYYGFNIWSQQECITVPECSALEPRIGIWIWKGTIWTSHCWFHVATAEAGLLGMLLPQEPWEPITSSSLLFLSPPSLEGISKIHPTDKLRRRGGSENQWRRAHSWTSVNTGRALSTAL